MKRPAALRRTVALVALGLLAGAALGAASNAITATACQQSAAGAIRARWRISEAYLRPDADPRTADMFERAGLRVKPCPFDHCQPWVDVGPVRWVAPYVISVSWGAIVANHVGEGGETVYLCFFGLAFELKRTTTWLT